jgi:hypothetical protein
MCSPASHRIRSEFNIEEIHGNNDRNTRKNRCIDP